MLARLDRIETLERDGAPPHAMLAEVRALLAEAEVWARRDGADVGEPLARCREALAVAGPARAGRLA